MSTNTQESQGNSQTSYTEREFQKKFFGLGAMCYYCAAPLLLKEAHREHKTPKCRGGSDHISNIVPSCADCNRKKAWRTEAEFIKARPGLFARAQTSRGIDKPKPSTALEVTSDECGLLKRMLRERDGGPSWSWRHPA